MFASVHRGDPIVVQGVLRVRQWDHNEKSGTSVEIDAQSVGFDLARGTAVFSRARREQPTTSDAPLAEEAVAAGLPANSAVDALASISAA